MMCSMRANLFYKQIKRFCTEQSKSFGDYDNSAQYSGRRIKICININKLKEVYVDFSICRDSVLLFLFLLLVAAML